MATHEPDPRCDECNKKLKPIFKATRFKRDWLYRQCDKCLSDICEDCSDENSLTGEVVCVNCMQMEALRKHGIIKSEALKE